MVINYTPKIAIRQAWTMCKTATTETTAKKKEEKNADSDSDDETNDPSLRRAALDEFRKRFHYSIPMHHQPSTFCCHPNPMVRVQNVGQNVCAILEEPRKTLATLFQPQRRGSDSRSRQRPGQPYTNRKRFYAQTKTDG